MLSYGLTYGFHQAAFDLKVHKKSAQTELSSFGYAEYERLEIGMSLTDVRSILGRGTEVSRSKTMATFVWESPDGYKITGIFEGDKLIKKLPRLQ
ncbi:hypothetical protein H6G77_14495 [Aulosira sp. FACHB-615]|nr:hypothetical protein [Aulosira sp. FACHB-615]